MNSVVAAAQINLEPILGSEERISMMNRNRFQFPPGARGRECAQGRGARLRCATPPTTLRLCRTSCSALPGLPLLPLQPGIERSTERAWQSAGGVRRHHLSSLN